MCLPFFLSVYLSVCLCFCVYVCMHMYISIYTYVYIYICIYIHTCMHMHMHFTQTWFELCRLLRFGPPGFQFPSIGRRLGTLEVGPRGSCGSTKVVGEQAANACAWHWRGLRLPGNRRTLWGPSALRSDASGILDSMLERVALVLLLACVTDPARSLAFQSK